MSKKSPLSDTNAVRSSTPEQEVTLDLGPPAQEPEPPVAPEEPAQPEERERASDEHDVRVLTSADMPRIPRYRVLNAKRLSWQANMIEFRVGDEFDASTHSPVALKAFQDAGLELEQIE